MKKYALLTACLGLLWTGCQNGGDYGTAGDTDATTGTTSGSSSTQTDASITTDTSATDTDTSFQSSQTGVYQQGTTAPSQTGTAGQSQTSSTQILSGADQVLVDQINRTLTNQPSASVSATLSSDDAKRIHITAQNGAVTLHGSVKSEQQKQQIESQVKQVSGVTSVNNQLTVSADQSGQSTQGQGTAGSSRSGQDQGSSIDKQRQIPTHTDELKEPDAGQQDRRDDQK